MRLEEFVPPPYARATACASPCAVCGADGEQPLAAGAALQRDVTLRAGDVSARVGIWASLPDGARAIEVHLSGAALDASLVTATAARVHSVEFDGGDERSHPRAVPFTGATIEGRRGLCATLAAPRARLVVVEVLGVARAVGEGDLTLRVTFDVGGCLTQRVSVSVVEALRAAPRYASLYVAAHAIEAPTLARLFDAVLGVAASCGAARGALALRAECDGGRRVEGSVSVQPRGIDGAAWTDALREAARQRLASIDLWDPRCPDDLGLAVALSTRARPAPCELSAWVDTRALDGATGALVARWWEAVDPSSARPLQCVVGVVDDPVTPRVPTAWERARGVRAVTHDARALERFARSPGELVWCRGRRVEGDEARRCWPGPTAAADMMRGEHT